MRSIEMEHDSERQSKMTAQLVNRLGVFESENLSNEKMDKMEIPLDSLIENLKTIPVKAKDNKFKDLPTEVKSMILDNLSDVEVIFASNVCKEWKQILLVRTSKNLTIELNESLLQDYHYGRANSLLLHVALKSEDLYIVLKISALPIHHLDGEVLSDLVNNVDEVIANRHKTWRNPLSSSQLFRICEKMNQQTRLRKILMRNRQLTVVDPEMVADSLMNVEHVRLVYAGSSQGYHPDLLLKKIASSTSKNLERLDLSFGILVSIPPEVVLRAFCNLRSLTLHMVHLPPSRIRRGIIINEVLKKIVKDEARLEEFRYLETDYGRLHTIDITALSLDEYKTVVSSLKAVFLNVRVSPEQRDILSEVPGVFISEEMVSKNCPYWGTKVRSVSSDEHFKLFPFDYD